MSLYAQWLRDIFGGNIARDRKPRPDRQDIYAWSVSGRKAADIMRLLAPYLSERRREQIATALVRNGDSAPLEPTRAAAQLSIPLGV